MNPITLVLSILLIVCALALLIVVMLQTERGRGMSGAVAGSSSSSNYYGKNKGMTKEALMKRITIILSIIFMVAVIVVDLLILYA